ncbi:hypothetical protein [Flavobacterium algicola]|nr:hypothetical protein [Flavobacterium algicola]MCG9792510.1 hypothetical protein [Flavobacterium algicola]
MIIAEIVFVLFALGMIGIIGFEIVCFVFKAFIIGAKTLIKNNNQIN